MPAPIQDAIRFCFVCGAKLPGPVPVTCTACGVAHYANSKPCVGVLVVRDGSVLLTQRAIEPYFGYWDIPGGFCEVGEHPEQSAVREMKEELGFDVQVTGYLGCWMDKYSDPTGLVDYSTLNMFYLAELLRDTRSPTDDEVSASRFFPIGCLPEQIAFPDHACSVLAALRRTHQG